MNSFQDIIFKLQEFWAKQGCALVQPIDIEVGAGTLHPATVLKALGDRPWKVAYTQACRRPTDARYGQNPNRLSHYYQFQVLLKPAPQDMRELYLQSLELIGVDSVFDIDFNGKKGAEKITYGDIYLENEKQNSAAILEYANKEILARNFDECENQAQFLIEKKLTIPAYEQALKTSHLLNLLDASGAISANQRATYIARVRNLVKQVCDISN